MKDKSIKWYVILSIVVAAIVIIIAAQYYLGRDKVALYEMMRDDFGVSLDEVNCRDVYYASEKSFSGDGYRFEVISTEGADIDWGDKVWQAEKLSENQLSLISGVYDTLSIPQEYVTDTDKDYDIYAYSAGNKSMLALFDETAGFMYVYVQII